MNHFLFLSLLLMILGYGTVEFARFRRALQQGRHDLYPKVRFALRTLDGLLVVGLGWWLVYSESPRVQGSIEHQVVLAALAVLFVSIAVDVTWLVRQFRGEARRREEQFLDEVGRLVRQARDGNDRKRGGAA